MGRVHGIGGGVGRLDAASGGAAQEAQDLGGVAAQDGGGVGVHHLLDLGRAPRQSACRDRVEHPGFAGGDCSG
ncbi:hypothetical protein SDC9_132681 [bioreactor metagenome]|uniref:Uncharacterized protein n=1 Tax=bioreactor metagenome TaxID=1076179 RepID=A0A645D7V2_9ZZZZ